MRDFVPLDVQPRPGKIMGPLHVQEALQTYHQLYVPLKPPPDFQVDRYIPGMKSTLSRSTTIWTALGVSSDYLDAYGNEFVVYNARLVNLYFHVGIRGSPDLTDPSDTNSFPGITQLWLRPSNAVGAFYRSICPDARRQEGATAIAILPESTGFFLDGFIAVSAQLVRSADTSGTYLTSIAYFQTFNIARYASRLKNSVHAVRG
ncbi:hypothetical protein ARMSODRAFT_1008876 [Armillaria solidipes]|uniref:Uncharacterized protein n=1 Tax=Armillaria solidipes TaxID=1076256 RepID=A0A2H3ARD8_9AGAR|nr:hypothetical protein ARMSODRAFT_1008876 [Armillaria solidipes]